MQARTNWLYFTLLMAALTFLGCPTKTTEPVTQTDPKPTTPSPQPEVLSTCPKFSDAPSPDDAETWYVLYRDFLRARDYKQSMGYWRKVYAVAPAADGRRNTVFSDGIFFYEQLYSETKNQIYIDSIFQLYDEINRCYPEGGYVDGRKGFDYFYKYPDRSTKLETYKLLKSSMDKDGVKTNDFVVNPFTALLTELHDSSLVSTEEARHYATLIMEIIENGLANCKDPAACDRWQIVQEYAPLRLEYFETVKGFYDCQYYTDKYYAQYLEAPTDCDVIRTVISRMNWGGCSAGQPKFDEVMAAYQTNCRVVASGPAAEGYACLQNGDYNCAIDKFQAAANESTDAVKKADYLLLIAKIYYVHKKNYSRARSFAEQAADVRGGWGEPYILIGRMYASSGPLCGPGRGWDSQVVVWPAIDMWNKARSIDPGSASEAQRWINQYARYMPKKEDVFFRGLQTGGSYYVGCWIQRSTTIRTAD